MKMRIPFINGNEFDALTRAKRFFKWRAGSRAAIKRAYNKRARKAARCETTNRSPDMRSKSYPVKLTAKIPLWDLDVQPTTITVDIDYSYASVFGYPTIEFHKATLFDGDGLEPTDDQIHKWVADWLDSDDGYDLACQHAVKCIPDLCGNYD